MVYCVVNVFGWTWLLQAGPMEEGIAPALASERLALFQVLGTLLGEQLSIKSLIFGDVRGQKLRDTFVYLQMNIS